jgi:hypothetical protein
VSWTLFRWTWRLESPLFVGAPPAGSLNRCRLYVPSRALWGALTAELARRRKNGFPNYQNEGTILRENTRFTYLFPAEWDGKRWRAWLPQYELRSGLVWRREDPQDGERDLADRQMRLRLVDARPGTAIDPDSDSAEEGSLRETECVLPLWRNNGSPVAFAGYVFLKNDVAELRDITVLFLGGDTRYGLGRLRSVGDWTSASDVFGAQVNLNQGAPSVRSNRLLAHTHQDAGGAEIIGSQESLAGWDRTKAVSFQSLSETPLWTPGSRIRDDGQAKDWEISEDGTWQLAGGGA